MLVLVLHVLRWVHVRQDWIDVVIQLLHLAGFDVGTIWCICFPVGNIVIFLGLYPHCLEEITGCLHAVKSMSVPSRD